jgi:DNA-binding transcriptional MerR regulator
MKRATPKMIANQVPLHANTIRLWADAGLITCVKDFRGRRWFPDADKTVSQIRELLGLRLANKGSADLEQ